MIVATPLDLPLIEPDDWELFWQIWRENSDFVIKKEKTRHKESIAQVGEKSIWRGLDIYKMNKLELSAWRAPYFDIRSSLPKMYQQLSELKIFSFLERVRIIESLIDIGPHTDDNLDRWNIRALFYCKDPSPQWYFNRPNLHVLDIKPLKLPDSTNWFAYNDKNCYHGSKYNKRYPKLILQLYGMFFIGNDLLKQSMEKYKDYVISYN